MPAMKTIADIRRDNLALLAEEVGTMDAVADKAETNAVYLSQVMTQTPDVKTGRPRALGTKLARRLEVAFAKPVGWMDQPNGSKLVAREEAKVYATVADMVRNSSTLRDVARMQVKSSGDLSPEKQAEYLAALDSLESEAAKKGH